MAAIVATRFLADLPCDLAHPRPDRPLQNLVSIFRDPDDVIAVMENRMFALVILHDL